MKILMHSCCGPCTVYPLMRLREEGHEVTSLWYNPNIHPFTEYKSRYEALLLLSEQEKFDVIDIQNYGIREFTKNVVNNIDARCLYCYESRLEITAKEAKERGFDGFTTSLLVSPYQKHELIINVCKKYSEKYDIEFVYEDFRVGFREGQNIAREKGLYMQKYCGCIYSEEERYEKQINKLISSKN